jgi:hypothetical protein
VDAESGGRCRDMTLAPGRSSGTRRADSSRSGDRRGAASPPVRGGVRARHGKVERARRGLRLETIVNIANGVDVDAGELHINLPTPPSQ